MVLRALGATLLFEVDATNLSQTLAPQLDPACKHAQYQQIVFNFPQTGSGFPGSEAWHKDHEVLLRGTCMQER
jgi:hypothetical protein